MPTPVTMPQMGESIAEGTIVRWIKKVGDAVDRDEPLFEISTDKVDAEIPSPAAGGPPRGGGGRPGSRWMPRLLPPSLPRVRARPRDRCRSPIRSAPAARRG